jgi:hypothetical protein
VSYWSAGDASSEGSFIGFNEYGRRLQRSEVLVDAEKGRWPGAHRAAKTTAQPSWEVEGGEHWGWVGVRAPGCEWREQPFCGGLWRELATGIERRSGGRANEMACPARGQELKSACPSGWRTEAKSSGGPGGATPWFVQSRISGSTVRLSGVKTRRRPENFSRVQGVPGAGLGRREAQPPDALTPALSRPTGEGGATRGVNLRPAS